MTIARRFADPLEIHCQRCRGKGQALQVSNDVILRTHCPECAGTGLRKADDASSAQPHRFSVDHPMLVVSSDPLEHSAAD